MILGQKRRSHLLHLRPKFILLLMLFPLITISANAAVIPDGGLLNNEVRNDPGFESGANQRWRFSGNDVPVFASNAALLFGATHFNVSLGGAAETGLLIGDTTNANNAYVSVTGPDTYRIEYWRQVSHNGNATGPGVSWYDSGNNLIRTESRAMTVLGATGVWEFDSWNNFFAPPRARKAVVFFNMVSGGANKTVFIDGVGLFRLGTPTAITWPCTTYPNLAVDTQRFQTNNAPTGFARMTRTGLPASCTFSISGGGSNYGNGAAVSALDTVVFLTAGGAAATLPAGTRRDSFITVLTKTTPDGTFGFIATSQLPVRIDSTVDLNDGLAGFTAHSVDVRINTAKSAEEKIWIRYTTDSWVSDTFVKSTVGVDTLHTVTLPSIAPFTTVGYYAFTTTAETTTGALVSSRVDYVTLAKGSFCTFTTGAGVGPTINSWHTVGNPAPETGVEADLYMRTATNSTGDTMWPRRRSTDNPVIFWVGKTPANETPTCTLFYETSQGYWSSVNASETVTVGDSIYFKFLLNQANDASFDYMDTVGYYFSLVISGPDSTYCHGNNTVDNITFSDSTKTEATARANPFVYRIRELRPTVDLSVPANGHDTGTTAFQVIGTATADALSGDTVNIYRNYIPMDTVYLNGSLAFVGWCTIAAKSDSIQVKLTSNSFGYTAWDTHRVSLYSNPGIAMHPAPVNGLETNQAFFQISGTCTDARPGDSVTIFQNGVATGTTTVTATGTWKCTASLAGKSDSIGARLTTFLGLVAWDTPRRVTFDFHRVDMGWVGIQKGDWSKYSDTIYNDGTSAYTEVVDDRDSYSGYMYYNKSMQYLWFRFCLDAPDTITWQHSTDAIHQKGWMLWLDVNMDGFADWSIGLTAQPTDNGIRIRYNPNNDQDFRDGIINYEIDNAYKSSGIDTIWIEKIPLSDVSGDSDIYLSYGFPISGLQIAGGGAKNVYETTPFRMLYGTGSSEVSIKRDLNGAPVGSEAAVFSGAQIVTTANFQDGAATRANGLIYDTRDFAYLSDAGSYEQGETVYFSGTAFPTNKDSIMVRIVLDGNDSESAFAFQGTIPLNATGGFTGNGFWRPTSANAAGVYQVWVRHPIDYTPYYVYDRFTVTARVSSISSITQAPESVTIGDSIKVVVRDTDQNTNIGTLQTVQVTFKNQRTGETEVKTLTETAVNQGWFNIDTMSTSSNAADSTSGTGKLYVRAGDTITVSYTDVQDTTDSIIYTSALVVPSLATMSFEITDAAGTGGITLLTEGETMGIRLIDRGLNRDALRVETYSIRLTNATTGETEDKILTEVSASTDTFFATLATETDIADSLSQSGIMYGTLTQNIWTTFTDPYQGSDVRTDTVTMLGDGNSSIRFTDASLMTLETVPIGGYLYMEVIDRNRNGNPAVQDTVSITLRSSNGDSQNVHILESANNSGIFRSIGYFVTDSGPVTISDSILTVLSSSTVTCSYVDSIPATDSSLDTGNVGLSTSSGSLIDASGTIITSQSTGDSIRIRATDIDENKSATALDTLQVIVSNTRTGETENAILTETSVTTGGFETSSFRLSQSFADSLSNNGAIMLLNGDTFTVSYTDANSSGDTFLLGAYSIVPANTAATGTFPPRVRLSDSIIPSIADADQNSRFDTIDTITITVTNNRTLEAEIITLFETDTNSGIFNITKIFAVQTIADSVDNDTLYVLAGDSIIVTYTDPTDGTDIVTGSFKAYFDTTASSGTFPTFVKIATELEPTINDTDQNMAGYSTDSITVTVTNHRTGETETMILFENSENAGYFTNRLLITSLSSDSGSGTGKLFGTMNDTLTVSYTDPTDATDSLTSFSILVLRDTSPSSGSVPSAAYLYDSFRPIIKDTDQDFSELTVETVTVTVTNLRTGETESLVLTETFFYSGAFDTTPLYLSNNPTDSVDNDTIFALAGDTLRVSYTDIYDTADVFTSSLVTVLWDSVAANGTFPSNVKLGDSVIPIIRDSDQNFNGLAVETISVTVTNMRTGETEIITLVETETNSGIFDVTKIFVVSNPADSAADNDTLFVLAGDTVRIVYTDPTDPTDSVTGGPFAVYHETTVSAGTFPSTVPIGDSIVPVIRDTDQNLNGTTIDTIAITITNNRTGETEIIILYETDSNSGYFDVTKIFVTGSLADSVDNDTLFVLLGDSISISYTDPTDTTDTQLGGPIRVSNPSSLSSGVFPATVKLGDSIVVYITDTDQNFSASVLDTQRVIRL